MKKFEKVDFEKKLFALQSAYRVYYRQEVLSHLFTEILNYCYVLFHYLKKPYDKQVAADIAEAIVVKMIPYGKYVEKSWKGVIIPMIHESIRKEGIYVTLNDYTLKFNVDVLKDRKDLLEEITLLLKKYMQTLAIEEFLGFLAYLRCGELSELFKSIGDDRVYRRLIIVVNVWNKLFKTFLLKSRKENVEHNETRKIIR